MNKDITYCGNAKECKLKDTCIRATDQSEHLLVWCTDFYNEEKECNYYKKRVDIS